MIPQNVITAWRKIANWGSPDQVEHDLVISRVICELYTDPIISEKLVFRGGTALHKLFFEQAGRFSEDLDFVQINPEPIGITVNAIRECLDYWLGEPSWKQSQGRFTLAYRFKTELEPIVTRKLKIEINTREHFKVLPYVSKDFYVKSNWFEGRARVLTYAIEELLGTKLRALYQRKKGRDLYDLWYVFNYFQELNTDKIVHIFEHYMSNDALKISRVDFENNLLNKQNDIVFNRDIQPLLSVEQRRLYDHGDAYNIVLKNFILKIENTADN